MRIHGFVSIRFVSFQKIRFVDSFRTTVFKRFVLWIRFVVRCSKDSFRGFVSYYGVQKIHFVDSICDAFWRIQRILTNPDESLLHRCTLDGSLGFANPYGVQKIRFVDSFRTTVFKRFVSWICFVLRCSKDSFRGFDSYYGVQKIRFVDSFRKTKNSKLLNSCTNPAS